MRKGHSIIVLAVLVGLVALLPSGAQGDDPPTWQYSAKFLCGLEPSEGTFSPNGPVLRGTYGTGINVHNPNFSTVVGQSSVTPGTRGFSPFFSPTFRKKALVLYGNETPRRPEEAEAPGPWVRPENLPYDWGFLIDCNDIRNVLLADVSPQSGDQPAAEANDPFLEGFVVIEARSFLPLDVVAVYTSRTFIQFGTGSATPEGWSEDTETIQPKRIR